MSFSCTKEFQITIPAAAALLSYWKCDDNPGGNVASIANSVVGMPAYTAVAFTGVSAPGKINTGVDTLDRTFETGAKTEYNIGLLDAFTARLWFSLPAFVGVLSEDVFSCYPLTLSIDDDGIADSWFALTLLTTAGNKTVATAPFTYATFHRVVVWFDNGVEIGIQLDNDAPVTLAIPGVHTLTSGSGTVNMVIARNLFMPTLTMDEVGMWNRKLTAAELLTDWNGGVGKSYPNVPL